jgi:molybdopterin-containing oxidoreductase family membrane subunit
LRDRAPQMWKKRIFGLMAMGWRGSAKHWARYEMAYLLLGGLATPLVVSVHTVVSFDFAVSMIPGWHTTIFPPYFVAGAIYSGFAMTLTLAIPLRKFYHLEDFITMRHLQNMAKVMLATGMIVAYGYTMEAFFSYYSADKFETFMFKNRTTGPYGPFYGLLILFNILIPQLLWSKRVRSSIPALFILSLVVNTGMWLERFVIVITSLHRDFLPSSWGIYYPTKWDIMTYIGTLGFFSFAFYLFIRLLPAISMFEMRDLIDKKAGKQVVH